MATYTLKFDLTPDANADGHTSTIRVYCCNQHVGDVTSAGANVAGVANWQPRSIDLTAHMTTGQPKADHYPSWHYVAGMDGGAVRHMRIESSTGGVWHDQYGGDNGNALLGVGYDGGGSAGQYEIGSYVSQAASGERVDHIIIGTDASADYPVLRIEFEQRPDTGVTRTNNDDSTITLEGKQANGSSYASLGTRRSELAGAFWANNGPVWASRSIPLGVSSYYELRWLWSGGNDGTAIRNVRLVAADGTIIGDEFLQAGWSPNDITGYDGLGPATQPSPAESPPGTMSATSDGWCHHVFEPLTPGLIMLAFELAPDEISTGGLSHRSRIECRFNGVYLGDAESLEESGGDGNFEWKLIRFNIDALWIGDGTDKFEWRYFSSSLDTAYLDAGHVRNARVETNDGILIEGDQFYPLWHGTGVVEATFGGHSGSSRVWQVRDVCTYEYVDGGTDNTYLIHNFPGDRCAVGPSRRPVVGFIGWR